MNNCPHCGFYCTGKTIFCTPPIVTELDSELLKICNGKDASDESSEHWIKRIMKTFDPRSCWD